LYDAKILFGFKGNVDNLFYNVEFLMDTNLWKNGLFLRIGWLNNPGVSKSVKDSNLSI